MSSRKKTTTMCALACRMRCRKCMPHSAHSEARHLHRWFCLLPLVVLPLSAASNVVVSQDRDGWTATIRGTIVSPSAQIDLIAGGDLIVRGSRGKDITYSIAEHFVAGDRGRYSETEIRQAALNLDATMERRHGALSLAFPCVRQVIRLEVPRSTGKVSVVSVAGKIDLAELDGSVVTRNGAGRTLLDHIGGDAEIRTAGGATIL